MVDFCSPERKAEIGASLLLLSPPSETREVVKDIKVLLGDNSSLEKKLLKALLIYSKEQTVQVSLPGSTHNSLITEHGEISPGRFLCPRAHSSFSLDPYSLAVDDVRPLDPDDGDGGSVELESWRYAIEESLTAYMGQNFPKGAVSVFTPSRVKPRLIVIYIESNFQKQFSTGRWKSSWTVTVPDHIKAEYWPVTGGIKIQTHIYEEGNVQLLSAKQFNFEVKAKNPETFAREFSAKIKSYDSDYQASIENSLDTMSTTTFKALRRQLPMTKSKLDWNKIASYQVGSEISRPN